MLADAVAFPTNLHGHRAVFAIGLLERDARVWQARQSATFSVLDWLAADVLAVHFQQQRGSSKTARKPLKN